MVCVPHTPSEVDERRRPSERSGAQLLNPRPAFLSSVGQPQDLVLLESPYTKENARGDNGSRTRGGDGNAWWCLLVL